MNLRLLFSPHTPLFPSPFSSSFFSLVCLVALSFLAVPLGAQSNEGEQEERLVEVFWEISEMENQVMPLMDEVIYEMGLDEYYDELARTIRLYVAEQERPAEALLDAMQLHSLNVLAWEDSGREGTQEQRSAIVALMQAKNSYMEIRERSISGTPYEIEWQAVVDSVRQRMYEIEPASREWVSALEALEAEARQLAPAIVSGRGAGREGIREGSETLGEDEFLVLLFEYRETVAKLDSLRAETAIDIGAGEQYLSLQLQRLRFVSEESAEARDLWMRIAEIERECPIEMSESDECRPLQRDLVRAKLVFDEIQEAVLTGTELVMRWRLMDGMVEGRMLTLDPSSRELVDRVRTLREEVWVALEQREPGIRQRYRYASPVWGEEEG